MEKSGIKKLSLVGCYERLDIITFLNHEFDFNQFKDTYDDWFKAFERAIAKIDGKVFMGLSSGYDSGALSHELYRQNVDFKCYSMSCNENKHVLERRKAYLPNWENIEMDNKLWQKYYDYLKDKVSEATLADIASMGLAYMFETAVKQGRKTFVSGQGSDEIIADYALYPGQSTFKGRWPDKLEEWENFRNGKQAEYLTAIEEVANIYGVEVKYPFIDIDLVQEYLWLKPELKNKHYKAPLYEYLVEHNVPLEPNVKRGYRPVNPVCGC